MQSESDLRRTQPRTLADLAPTGALRAAVPILNAALATKDPATGAVRGVAVELGDALARQLGVPLVVVE